MKTSKILEGIRVLEHYRERDGHDITAEQGKIRVYAPDKPIQEEDVAYLIELGWTQEDIDNFDASKYNQEVSWVCRV